MFRSARWKGEKNKIKAVFKLQFHATQVTQVGIDALMISVIPADVGKPTAKLEKVSVQDGSCHWKNPVLETVKFDREAKSGKIHERIYRFVVGTGSPKAGVVGEASIDLSNYAEATKMSSVSLPLKNSKSEILLHVSVQRLQDAEDQRGVEECETAKDKSQDRSLRAQLSNDDMDGSDTTNSMEDGTFNKAILQTADLNGNRRTSSGSDLTMSSSDCSSGLDTPTELQLKNRMHQTPTNLLSSNHESAQRRLNDDATETLCDEALRPKWGWQGGSAVEVSNNDSSRTPREILQRMSSREESDDVVEKLRADLMALARQAEVSELELQTLRKQIVKEGKRGQDLSQEVTSLKKERDSLKEDCEKLKSFQKQLDEAKAKHMSQLDGGDLRALIEELRQELHYEKDLNANLRIQLQKTQESNSELILAVRDLDEMLEQKSKEMLNITSKSGTHDVSDKQREVISKREIEDDDDDEEQKALEQLVREHSDAKEMYLMEQKIMNLHNEIEIYRREKDDLEVQMEQLALDYEILKQEHHDMSYKLDQSQLQERLKVQYECTSSYATVTELEAQIEKLESDLKKREREFSDSLSTISRLENHAKDLEEELEKQAQGFEADLEAVTCAKVEQEQRAIRAEEALRKTRRQNASTAERIQEEFRWLSVQMASTFEANERLATKAMAEANDLRLQKMNLEDKLRICNEELESLKDHYKERLQDLSNQVVSLSAQIGQMETEIADKSMKLEDQEKHADKTHQLLSAEIIILKADIENLSKENKFLCKQADRRETLTADMELMQKSIVEMEMLIEQGNKERTELETRVAMMKKEAEQSFKELNHVRCLKDDKELRLADLLAQVDMLKTQCDDLRSSLHEGESEKEKLKKQVIQLKGDLKKKEETLKMLEKKLKDSNCRSAASDGVKPSQKSNKSVPVPYGTKEIANLKEKIRLLEGQIKQKEAALETSTNTFLEKEKELQNQIEDLAKTLEVLYQNSASSAECKSEKVHTKDITLAEEERSVAEYVSPSTSMSNENKCATSSLESNSNLEIEGLKGCSAHPPHINDLSDEVVLLKEKNKIMEEELKEMQGRYSEISLKFAEVEGERQQLVMTLRNLKNAKKS